MGAGQGNGGAGASDATIELDFDAWADLSARLLHLDMDRRIDILEEREVSIEEWMRCDDHYATALAADIAAGRTERAESYGRKCAAEIQRRKRLAESQPEGAATEAEQARPDPEPAPAAFPVPAVEPAVPTFLNEPPPVATRPALSKELSGTISVDNLPSFVKQGTSKPLPFGDTPSAEFVAAASAPRPPPPSGAGETLGLDSNLVAQIRAALPYAKPDDSSRKPGAAPVGETMAVDAALVARGAGSLPFPPKPSAPSFPRLPLQTYASLCVELAHFPDRAAEVLRKYGVKDEEARRALDQDWHARFTAHPDTRQEWAQACATYRDWLLRQPR